MREGLFDGEEEKWFDPEESLTNVELERSIDYLHSIFYREPFSCSVGSTVGVVRLIETPANIKRKPFWDYDLKSEKLKTIEEKRKEILERRVEDEMAMRERDKRSGQISEYWREKEKKQVARAKERRAVHRLMEELDKEFETV
jgi:hypothetical protein